MIYTVLMRVEVKDGELKESELRRLIRREIGERPEIERVEVIDCDPSKAQFWSDKK